MTSLTVADLKAAVGSKARLTVPSKKSPTGVIDIEGTVLAAEQTGVVLQTTKGVEIFELAQIYEAVSVAPTRKLVRRKLSALPDSQARQHLIDRHGMPVDLVRSLTAEQAGNVHRQVNHSNLGHMHTEPKVTQADDVEIEVSPN